MKTHHWVKLWGASFALIGSISCGGIEPEAAISDNAVSLESTQQSSGVSSDELTVDEANTSSVASELLTAPIPQGCKFVRRQTRGIGPFKMCDDLYRCPGGKKVWSGWHTC